MSQTNDQPDQTPSGTDLSTQQLGNFRLLRRLGRGAMADVYLAEQCLLRRQVAVKILKPELADDHTYLRRFEREAQAAAALVHANIVQIHEVGHVDRLHYIAQEYVQGQNLREWISRNSPPDLPHILSIMRQVAAALAKASEQGVVHRDIKPENIMLTRSGEVKVADFGLARIAREGEALDLTRIGITMGTPLYMSPEQVEGKPLDHRSDLYSFGVTCYHMLTGSPPFGGETALGVAVQHLKKQPEPLESLRPDLPAPLCRLIHKMLGKSPERRCQSALEVLRELRRIHLEHLGDNWPEDLPGWETTGIDLSADARRQLTAQLGSLMKADSPRRGRWTWAVLAVGLLASLVLGGGLALSTQEPYALANVELPPPEITKKATALEQYLHASTIGTEGAWRSVIQYFPESSLARRAEQQLARIYLQQGENDRAMAIFEKFASPNEPNDSLRAFGLAGKYSVLTIIRRDTDRALLAQILDQLAPIRGHLDGQMQMMLSRAIDRNLGQLEDETRQTWEDFVNETFSGGQFSSPN